MYSKRKPNMIYDIEIMEVARQCGIDLIEEVHLLRVLEEVLN